MAIISDRKVIKKRVPTVLKSSIAATNSKYREYPTLESGELNTSLSIKIKSIQSLVDRLTPSQEKLFGKNLLKREKL
ncbi:hypothetical protein, partial [Vibrio aquimaris]